VKRAAIYTTSELVSLTLGIIHVLEKKTRARERAAKCVQRKKARLIRHPQQTLDHYTACARSRETTAEERKRGISHQTFTRRLRVFPRLNALSPSGRVRKVDNKRANDIIIYKRARARDGPLA
jgi:uncharacterized protein (DUF2384 family)